MQIHFHCLQLIIFTKGADIFILFLYLYFIKQVSLPTLSYIQKLQKTDHVFCPLQKLAYQTFPLVVICIVRDIMRILFCLSRPEPVSLTSFCSVQRMPD